MTRPIFDLQGPFFTLLPQKCSGELSKSVALAIWLRMSHPLTTRGLSDSMLHCSTSSTYWSLVLPFNFLASFPLSGCCLHTTIVAILLCYARLFQHPALVAMQTQGEVQGVSELARNA